MKHIQKNIYTYTYLCLLTRTHIKNFVVLLFLTLFVSCEMPHIRSGITWMLPIKNQKTPKYYWNWRPFDHPRDLKAHTYVDRSEIERITCGMRWNPTISEMSRISFPTARITSITTSNTLSQHQFQLCI